MPEETERTDGAHLTVRFDARDLPGPHVRPIGCHPETPIVRRIGDRDLFLGNRHAADPERAPRSFDAVCTVAEERSPATTHHVPLVDGPEAEWARFKDAVETARSLHRSEGSVLVHCKAGISRSTTVLATTIATEEGRPLREAFEHVWAARPHAVAHPRLHELAVWYVAAVGERSPDRNCR